MRKTFRAVMGVAAVAAVAAACSEGQGGPMDLQFGAASPNQMVAAQGTIEVAVGAPVWQGDGTYRSGGVAGHDGAGNAHGTCWSGSELNPTKPGGAGYWKNPQGNSSQHAGHSNCENGQMVASTETIVENFSFIATWVEARNGNRNLNFAGCENDEENGNSYCTTDNFIHYHAKNNVTTGSGYLFNDAGWVIDLSEASGAGNTIAGQTITLSAYKGSTGASVTLNWN